MCSTDKSPFEIAHGCYTCTSMDLVPLPICVFHKLLNLLLNTWGLHVEIRQKIALDNENYKLESIPHITCSDIKCYSFGTLTEQLEINKKLEEIGDRKVKSQTMLFRWEVTLRWQSAFCLRWEARNKRQGARCKVMPFWKGTKARIIYIYTHRHTQIHQRTLIFKGKKYYLQNKRNKSIIYFSFNQQQTNSTNIQNTYIKAI